ncbi:PREDICTED: extensin-like [Cyphomyrmex costatus]|uniref:extensin-like n=1 Tax=Cyphomyrmex costatus TaxID=456900 RepID=UPI000852451A|nr:PREDICTED: extensin-like [Cyphomyrmex costatus]
MQGYTSQQFLPQLRARDKARQLQLPSLPPHQQQPPQPPPQQPPQPPPQQPPQPPPQQPPQPPPQQTPQPPPRQTPRPPQPQQSPRPAQSPRPQPSQPPQQQPSQPPTRQRGTSLIQRLRQQLLRRRQLQATSPRIRPVEATELFRRQPRLQHPRGQSPQPPPGSPTQSTPPPTPPAVPPGPQATAVKKVTLQLAAWKLHPLDIPPPARTRPPRYYLHPWDLRVRRYTSPRYLPAPPPAGEKEPFSGSEWETTSQPGDENANYWGPEKRTATKPSLTYRERVSEKRRSTKWTYTQPPLTYKERSPSK